jgi:hypothetical protein
MLLPFPEKKYATKQKHQPVIVKKMKERWMNQILQK